MIKTIKTENITAFRFFGTPCSCDVVIVEPQDRGSRARDGGPRRTSSNVRHPRPTPNQGPPQIQLLALPQLDSIQRILRILDVRLQHVQNDVKNDDREKQDIDHIRRLMSENQSALASLVTTLASIQEEVRTVRVLFSKQQANTFQISPPGGATMSISKPRQQLVAQKPAETNKDMKSPQTRPKPFLRMNSRV